MKSKRCTCTYDTLVRRGFKPLDHNELCPLNRYRLEQTIKVRHYDLSEINQGECPYKETWLDEANKIRYEQLNKQRLENIKKANKK